MTFNKIKDCRYGKMIYNVNDWYMGRSLDLYGEFSEGEVKLFRQFIKEGMYVLDLGANIGCHTLIFSQLVGNTGKVFAYEPQRIIYQTLCGNMAINSVENVYCYQKAIFNKVGITKIEEPSNHELCNFGMVTINQIEGVDVETINLDSINVDKCDFIKADIENMEYEMIEGGKLFIKKFRPIMYLEDNMTDKSEALIDLLISLNYKLFKHTTPYYNKDNFLNNNHNVFTTVCSFNILCLPREKDFDSSITNNISDLKPIY
ncbi:MAG: FkbM family methyltransferase [Candidatus Sericytochromatia bacterium]